MDYRWRLTSSRPRHRIPRSTNEISNGGRINMDYINYIATCRTKGCENENIGIEVPAAAVDPTVYCGPCGNQITDLVPVTEES